WNVMEEIIKVVNRTVISTVDITGGAPELNPYLKRFIDELHNPGLVIILRTNLVALGEPAQAGLAEFLKEKNVKLAASLPCHMEENVTDQRGDETFTRSIVALKKLNNLGYGTEEGPELDLVYNPGGPFLPGKQGELESAYRKELKQQHGITFNRLLVLTNMPLGRFKNLLFKKNQLNEYLALLQNAYNQSTLSGLMCRSQISVGWDGVLYDCDFNLALGSPAGVEKAHITCFDEEKLIGRTIVTGNHCFGCTAGAGSSCSGSLEAGA
ncbi:MAG: arsenosugar biosynthesis radical SAM (seleno)protein ArsS, partial [Bacillota bacterium]